MKRTIYAAAFCTCLLIFGAVTMTRPVEANKDVVDVLLELPAPPPPNPLMPKIPGERPAEFYDQTKPPADDAPIEDILDYWAHQSAGYQELGYNILPSPRVLQRLRAEVSKNPEEITKYLNAFRGSEAGADFVKDLHDRLTASVPGNTEPLRTWLKWNSRHFAEDLMGPANESGESEQYVTNHNALLALGRNAWERAEPIVNRHYNDHSSPAARVMAMWALYRRALDTDSIGDVDRYRAELMEVVEDRNATPGMRDLALDALVKEKEWSGRDEWYFSLMADETLADLRIDGRRFTGLTTLIYHMPHGHYTEKMIEFAGSDNRTIRNAAVRNLLLMNNRKADERIIRALLPWLRDKEWAAGESIDREALIRGLQTFKIPEAVPGLIALLDERDTREIPRYSGSLANAANSAAEAAAWAANAAATAATTVATTNTNAAYRADTSSGRTEVHYPYRAAAIGALKTQADARAVPALRRILATTEGYGRGLVVEALLASGGFSVQEKVDAVQAMARVVAVMYQAVESELGTVGMYSMTEGLNERTREVVNRAVASALGEEFSRQEVSVEGLLGDAVMSDTNPSEELVRAMIDRIELLEKRDPAIAAAMRSMATRWKGPAVNTMLLRDLRNGKSDPGAIVKLLANRKELRETQMNNVLDAAGGVKWAGAVSACILEDRMMMEQMLAADVESATAVLACARLIRAPLDVNRVAALLGSTDARVVKAAEQYLESEDSREARAILLARYPNQAKIYGATAFSGDRAASVTGLDELFESVTPGSTSSGYPFTYHLTRSSMLKTEDEGLKEEILRDAELLGIYSYGSNKIRIYANRVIFAAEEDDKRYRERPLTAEEFKYLREYLAENEAGDLKPFLGKCQGCEPKQLVMLGKAGGRRVFVSADRTPEFFAVLDEYFETLKAQPGRLKYTAESEIAGLEVELADDNLVAEAVWKEGSELKVLLKDRDRVERVQNEIDAFIERAIETDEEDEDGNSVWSRNEQMQKERMWEGYAWWSIPEEGPLKVSTAPPGIEYPPARDGLSVERDTYPWSVTAKGTELRYDEEGLHAVRGGRLSRIAEGRFSTVYINADGRWAAAMLFDPESNYGPVRIDLSNGRVYPVEAGEETGLIQGYIPELNRFIMGDGWAGEGHDYHGEYEEFPERRDHEGKIFYLLDPTNGEVRKAPGEVRPIVDQTYRSLQPTGKAGEYWAALPDNEKDETVVGIYEARFTGFKPVLKVPKMNFNSMDMWVDAPGGRVYFIYKGHVLSVPLRKIDN